MKLTTAAGRSQFRILIYFLPVILGSVMVACEPDSGRLGLDIIPTADTILVYTDTITDFHTMLVRSNPRKTSLSKITATEDQVFLLGSKVDTMTGISKAEIVAQLSITNKGIFGEDPYVDSLQLWLYVDDVEGDTAAEMHIKVHELLERIYYDSVYYSDYDVTGKYDPEPLIDEVIAPKAGEIYDFHITDQDYLNRIIEAARDTIFSYNSLFQEEFFGFYITTEQVAEGGAIARLPLADDIAGLQFRYLHGSVLIDTAKEADFDWYSANFHEWYAQKINIFKHDFSGTALENLIDDPDARPHIGYAQGMAGVNVKITIPDFLDFFGGDTVALNAANLIFYVLPDSVSGIPEEKYPDRLMMTALLPDGSYQNIYDYVINSNSHYFGKLTQSNERSTFLDPLYFYNFHLARHYQSVLSFTEELQDNDLVIFVNDPVSTSKLIKFWTNYSDQEGAMRLELIYTKI
ncbi:MAG: DUF4270 domain-containing protein [Bacteroidales bacterium]|nr:DUF4270 domain-containing protein [Bacteroidales bacterium]